MQQPLGMRRARTAPTIPTCLIMMLVALAAVVPLTQSAQAVPAPRSATAVTAAAPLSVAQARATQNGSIATVRGYVVGQPTASATVVRSGFPNDHALALADSAGVTDTSAMVYVQIPSAHRAGWGCVPTPG